MFFLKKNFIFLSWFAIICMNQTNYGHAEKNKTKKTFE